MATSMLAGDGSYSYEIVGEGRYQAELQSICGNAEGEFQQECLALLVADLTSPLLTDEVSVEINGRRVGSLARADAGDYRRSLAQLGIAGNVLACRALITCEGNGEEGEQAYFSVELDLVWPPLLVSAAAGRSRREHRARTRSQYRLGMALATAAFTSIALGLLVWQMPVFLRRSSSAGSLQTESAKDLSARDGGEQIQPGASMDARAVCSDPRTIERAWEIVQNSGVVRSVASNGDILVDERLWDAMPQDDRQRFAAATFCRVTGTDGAGSILVLGANDGRLRGSMVNGAWLDPPQSR
jgi:hypothetical protein